jgi:uncharacterized protein (TIGR00369 family)
MSSIATPPDPGDSGPKSLDIASPDVAQLDSARLHWRALEGLYASAPINSKFESRLEITQEARARITFDVSPDVFHAAGAAHGTIYFKMLDDAAFYAANTLVTDRFLLTTSFNLQFLRPIREGRVTAEGRWVSGRKRVFVAESRLIDGDGEEVGRGTGTFMRSHIPLASLPGYAQGLRRTLGTQT